MNMEEFIMVNPYKPGAGTMPEYLAGRDNIINNTKTILSDLQDGGMATHTIFYGVRGVGKTVLLNKIESIAATYNYLYVHIECDEHFNFAHSINLTCKRFIKQMSKLESAKELINKAKTVLLSFRLTYGIEDNDISFGIDKDSLVAYECADSGDLSQDLLTLLIALGELASKCGKQICFFIDEIQNIKKKDLTAFIVSLHRINQLNLPIILIGAGLPTILRISSDTKSYAERLFDFVKITSLKPEDATKALIEPARKSKNRYSDDAIEYILKATGNYPFFIQQYGKIIWKLSNGIGYEFTKEDAENVYNEYIEKLDDSFFSTRFNKSTKAEKNLLFAMASFDKYPCSTKKLAIKMKSDQGKISPIRNRLINKGLLYAPSYGEIDFTVPFFDDYLRRIQTKTREDTN